jgi:hypothetical protein
MHFTTGILYDYLIGNVLNYIKGIIDEMKWIILFFYVYFVYKASVSKRCPKKRVIRNLVTLANVVFFRLESYLCDHCNILIVHVLWI